jgi:DNA-binding transcriptional MerR regulator
LAAYDDVPGLRIGEVANRTQMTIAALRAWEQRYKILTPARTAGGQRLYTEADVERVRFVQRLVAEGWSIAGAVARLHADTPADEDPPDAGRIADLGQLADVDSEAVLVAYQTARAMMRASHPREVRDALVALVERLGGTVGPAAEQDDEVLPVDLSMGEDQPVLPRAPATSIARLRLEAILPGLVEDARELANHQRLGARRVSQEA